MSFRRNTDTDSTYSCIDRPIIPLVTAEEAYVESLKVHKDGTFIKTQFKFDYMVLQKLMARQMKSGLLSLYYAHSQWSIELQNDGYARASLIYHLEEMGYSVEQERQLSDTGTGLRIIWGGLTKRPVNSNLYP
jgi:hypothetical protein